MKIHFYGRLAEQLGRDVELDIRGDCSIAELRGRLATDYPDAAEALARRVRACVGDTIVGDSHVVRPGDTIEFLPPVSGG